MPQAIERVLANALSGGSLNIGEITIIRTDAQYALCHRAEVGRSDLRQYVSAENALDIARFDDAGEYRPLKTAPNLRHGWRLQVATLGEARVALDYFYPGRLAAFVAAQSNRLETTSLREALGRQTGMYRVAAGISDAQIDDVIGNFCRSDGGCLRTILWKRDESGQEPSSQLPSNKYDSQYDQARTSLPDGLPTVARMLPLLCQEACNLVVGECRKTVQAGKGVSPNPL
jgi:sirohydrochlorin cobaltochelatase